MDISFIAGYLPGGQDPGDSTRQLIKLYGIDTTKEQGVISLRLVTVLSLSPGCVVSSLTRAGSGFLIRNNKVGFTRARGILVKASDGIIQANRVEGCELSGIVLSPELSWMEAGFSHQVTIRNNTVKDCMFANSSYGTEQAAPISVIAINVKKEIAPAGGFQNIAIENNQIINSTLPAIIVTSLTNGSISANKINISNFIKRTHGKNFGVDNNKVIWTKNVTNVMVANNDN